MNRDSLTARITVAQHAVQSGVALEIEQLGEHAAGASPKHLRVGVNGAMCDHAALAQLLIEKGVITDEEYLAALAEEHENERDRYQARLSERFGANIRLG